MTIRTKICGLSTTESVAAAQDNGAEFLGFIFHPKSPRYVTPQQAGEITRSATAKKVAVVVDASDEFLSEIVQNLKPDYIQLHGKEHDNRAMEIKHKFHIPLIRAVEPNKYPELNQAESPAQIQHLYDFLLVDAPGGGGKGIPFDWTTFTPPKHHWFLSGGLNIDNITEAITTTHAALVDVSSGVESAPGVKDLAKIKAFLVKVHSL